ncbi:MAG: XdhC family protein [Oscillibacter sp.]
MCVVTTWGHQWTTGADLRCRSGAKYSGCMAQRKLALCRERLLAAGFTDEEYARLHAPIGSSHRRPDAGGDAVSVAAEMIAVWQAGERAPSAPWGDFNRNPFQSGESSWQTAAAS